MLGFRYLKASPTTHVMRFRGGRLLHQGVGSTFWYFAPSTTLVTINVASIDSPFIFNEMTSDFQEVTIQGQLTYRVSDPSALSKALDHTVDIRGRYTSDDPSKVQERLVQSTQVACRGFLRQRTLMEILGQPDSLSDDLRSKLIQSEVAAMLGLEILAVNVLAISATPEMAKAMQADTRERLLLKADEAVYARRNVAIELERQISENQLKTEKAVEEKRREVRETQMEAEIAIESQRAQLVEQQIANDSKLAKARSEALAAMMETVRNVDWRTLAATLGTMDAKQTMAMAFQQLAENADKVANLQITPDLLRTMLDSSKGKG